MAESKNEENSEDDRLQFVVNKFDPKLKLNELKTVNYKQFVNWVESIQKQVDAFKEAWKDKINALKNPLKNDALNNSLAIVRCFDEERYHLNNLKGLARFTTPQDKKRGVYYYTYPFNEYIAYKTAEALGWQKRIPETTLGIIFSESFHDILDRHQKEKICSIKKKIPAAIHPLEYTLAFFKEREEEGKSVKEILESFNAHIDQQSFEEVFLLSWLIGETDGSSNKYLFVPENDKLAFLKTNCLTCFSTNYFETDSFLLAFSHLNKNLSKQSQEKLLDFDDKSIVETMKYFGKDQGAIACFRDRVRFMKALAHDGDVPLRSFAAIGLRKNHWKLQSFLLKLYHEGIAFT